MSARAPSNNICVHFVLRAGIREGRKRVKLAIALFTNEEARVMTPCERLTPKEIRIAILVWEGMTNREIGRIVGTSEQVIKNHLEPCPANFRNSSPLRAYSCPISHLPFTPRRGTLGPDGKRM
jgi:FixJ family two-component response regulator